MDSIADPIPVQGLNVFAFVAVAQIVVRDAHPTELAPKLQRPVRENCARESEEDPHLRHIIRSVGPDAFLKGDGDERWHGDAVNKCNEAEGVARWGETLALRRQ